MAAPQVQTLAQVMSDLNPAYAGQEAVNQQQQAGLGAKYDAQRSALTAEKGQGFNAINNQATGRGMSFSGIPLDEQATYLSTKYLPGMQAANAQQNQDQMTLQAQAAQLATQKYTQAYGTVQNQTHDLNSWNMQQAQLEAQAQQNELNRQSQLQLARENNAAQAAQNNARIAASQPKALTPYQSAFSVISSSLGSDGFVSPGTFQLARDAFKLAGGNTSDFASQFWKYTGANSGQANANNWKSYYYG